jgi:hypothetical protein
LAAYEGLEHELGSTTLPATSSTIDQARVTLAVAWHFTQQMLPEVVAAERFPKLVAYSTLAEALPEFAAAPHGDSTFSYA